MGLKQEGCTVVTIGQIPLKLMVKLDFEQA